jgi:phosphatidylserine synthase
MSLAALCDILDGFVARSTKSKNDFGHFLDTITDLVLFTIAPSFFMYRVFINYNLPISLLLLIIPPLVGVVRISYTESERRDITFFRRGLARGASATLWISLFNSSYFDLLAYSIWPIPIIVFGTVILQIIPIEYPNHHGANVKRLAVLVSPIIVTILGGLFLAIIKNKSTLFFDTILFWNLIWVILAPLTIYVLKKNKSNKAL